MAADKNGERAVDARVAQLQEITYAFSDALLDLSETIERIRKGMWMAVNQPGGTCGRARLDDEASGIVQFPHPIIPTTTC